MCKENVLICTSCRRHFTDNDLKKISVKNSIDVLLNEYDKLFPNGIIEKIAFSYDEGKKNGPRR